jgi:TetR/AcrR family fatty acid metabolism transcriptional regulator
MEKSKRKEMEFQIRRTEILNQAEKMFALKGFYVATMAEIADASGFAIGTLYHFFEGKENLYTTMVSEKLDMMYSEIRDAVNMADTAVDKIEMLVRSHFCFVENNVDFCNLFIRGEGATLSKGKTILRDKMNTDYLNHIGFIEEIMRLGIKTNSLKVTQPRMMAFALSGIIRSFILGWLLTNQDHPLRDKVDCVLDIFLKGVSAEVRQ